MRLFQDPLRRNDVDDDGEVQPKDALIVINSVALLVINQLNRQVNGGSGESSSGVSSLPFVEHQNRSSGASVTRDEGRAPVDERWELPVVVTVQSANHALIRFDAVADGATDDEEGRDAWDLALEELLQEK